MYAVTDAADAYFPKAYGELTNELLGYVADTDRELLDELFAKRREARIANARDPARRRSARSARRSPSSPASSTRTATSRAGRRSSPGVFRIVEHNCAIWAVAERYGQACTSELEFIRTVLDGADVERVQHMVAGARRCAYEVRARCGPTSSAR